MRKAQRKVGKDVSIDEPLQPLLTIADVCRMLSLSRPKIYDLISEGLPVLRFGRAVRFLQRRYNAGWSDAKRSHRKWVPYGKA